MAEPKLNQTDDDSDVESSVNDRMKAKARHRSPNYPFVSLEKAVERARQIYDQDRRHDVPFAVAAQRWGYKPSASQAIQTLAALNAYRLVDVSGNGDKRTARVSDIAHRIILNAPDAPNLLKDAAIAPAINNELWQKFGVPDGLPSSDDLIRHFLIWEKQFNEDVVPLVIANFRDSISFAKMGSSDILSESKEDKKGDDQNQNITVGDFIQWESNGKLNFPKPCRVIRRTANASGEWLFVAEYQAGFPVAEARRVDPPQNDSGDIPMNTPPLAPPQQPPGPPINPDYVPQVALNTDTFTIGGTMARIQWPAKLSAEQFEELSDWVQLQLRRTARESGVEIKTNKTKN